jgi:copper transport protein
MRRLIPVAAALLLAAAALPRSALAHAYPVNSTPAYGQALAHAPHQIRIVFSDSIRPAHGNAAVSNATGRSILSGPARVEAGNARELVLPLVTGLPRGNYTARWRVISDDGHTEEGLLEFRVGSGVPASKAGLPLLGTGLGATNLIGRALFVLGVLVSLGVAIFALVVWMPALRSVESVGEGEASALLRAREARTTAIVLFSSFLISQLGSVLAIVHATTSTRYGRMHELAIVFAGVGAASTASTKLPFRVVAALAALALATTPSLAGHALDPGESQPLGFGADLLHVWAAGLWLGGLLALALALQAVRSSRLPQGPSLTSALAGRFSRLALAAVGLIGLTGLGRALVELTSVSQLWSLGYGRAILVKTGLLAAVLVVAWVNRSRLLPHLARPGAAGRVTVSALAELGLLVAVVGAVAVLTDLRPGRSRGQSAPAAATYGQPPARAAVAIATKKGADAVLSETARTRPRSTANTSRPSR